MKANDPNARRLAAALRALARLLDYPGESLLENIDAVADALAAAPVPVARRASLRRVLDRLANGDALQAQEHYVDTFDRGRRTSLNLFEHVHGDSRDRGQAMVDLLTMYRAAGIEPASDQLPDYLPAFLEFLSVLEPAAAREHLGEVTHLVRAIGGVLAARKSDYAGAFDLLLALANEAPIEHKTGAETEVEDDTSFAAIDAAWLDAPVDFMGAAAPCGTSRGNVTEQPIQFQRRSA